MLSHIAGRQHGRLTRKQLKDAGLRDGSIGHWLQSGRLHRVRRGVYALGHAAATPDADAMAAVLAVGEGAALCRRSALALRGIAVEPVAFFEVTVDWRRRHLAGIRV